MPYLPIGVHVAVVDPGVGTARAGVAMQTARGDYPRGPRQRPAHAGRGQARWHHACAPSGEPALRAAGRLQLLPRPRSLRARRSPPCRRRGHRGAGPGHGPRRLLGLEWPRPQIGPGLLRAQAIYIDTFGNIKLSALADDLASALPDLRFGERLSLRLGEGPGAREVAATWARTFGDVAEGAPLLTADSYGRASLAVHQGSAATSYGVSLDSVVEVARPSAPVRPARPPRPASPPPPPWWRMPTSLLASLRRAILDVCGPGSWAS